MTMTRRTTLAALIAGLVAPLSGCGDTPKSAPANPNGDATTPGTLSGPGVPTEGPEAARAPKKR